MTEPITANCYLFVDLETGGLNPEKHSILQIAAYITDLEFKIRGHFMSYIKPHPELEITNEALAVNRLTWEDLQTAPEEKAVAHALHHFANLGEYKARFAGYNCQFDLEFLDRMWKRYELNSIPYSIPWLDIYSVTKTKLNNAGLPNLKLTSVASHFGLSITGAHDAAQDLLMTIEIAKLLKSMPDLNGIPNLQIARFTGHTYTEIIETKADEIVETHIETHVEVSTEEIKVESEEIKIESEILSSTPVQLKLSL